LSALGYRMKIVKLNLGEQLPGYYRTPLAWFPLPEGVSKASAIMKCAAKPNGMVPVNEAWVSPKWARAFLSTSF